MKASLLQTLHAQLKEIPGLHAKAAETDFELNDETLRRYLVMTEWRLQWNDQKLSSLVVNTVEWRREMRVGSMTEQHLSLALKLGQIYVNGYDRDGRAVVIYTPTTDSACSLAVSMQFLVFNLERALALSAENGIAQYSFIVDLVHVGAMAPLKTVKASFDIMGRHYPGRVGKILLVHGGSMIQMLWRVLEPIIPDRTRQKVSIVPERHEEEMMAQHIDPSQLETRFKGGTMSYVYEPHSYFQGLHQQPQLQPPERAS